MTDEALLAPIFGPPPEVPLCQHAGGSCAACCGVDNFWDRSDKATYARLARRTAAVKNAWPDKRKLIAVRDALLAQEKEDVLFPLVKACPFAGWTVEGEQRRIGCLIHPSRHPDGEDLRDISVYSKEICAGHFCAPHDWLRPREVALAQTAPGIQYGRVVTDAGLVKSIVGMLDELLARPLVTTDLARAPRSLSSLWKIFANWPWKDPDPRRFGGVRALGDDATERTCHALFGLDVRASRGERTLLDGLGSIFDDDDSARAALDRLRRIVGAVAKEIEAPLTLRSTRQPAPRPRRQ